MRQIAILLLVFTLSSHLYASEIANKNWQPIRGAQLFVLSPEYNKNYDEFFEELSKKGVNTLFVRVFHNRGDSPHSNVYNACPDGGVYFKSSTTCTVDNILPDIIKAGHKHGISVYAWMATRSLSFLKHSDTMAKSFSPTGAPIDGYGADLFNPEVRRTLKQLFQEIATTGVDGVLLQDDFIMKYTEGAGKFACAKFTADTGIACQKETFYEISGTKFGKAKDPAIVWYKWKARQLQQFLKEMRRDVRLINPNMKWAVNIYYETPIFPDKGLAWYAQDIAGIWSTGVDYIAVMAYQEQIASEMQFNRNEFLQFMYEMSGRALATTDHKPRVIFKLQGRLFDSKHTKVSAYELRQLCNYLEDSNANSFVQLPISSANDIIQACGFN